MSDNTAYCNTDIEERILSSLNKSQDEIRQEGADLMMAEL